MIDGKWNYFRLDNGPKHWMLQWDWDHNGRELTETVFALSEGYIDCYCHPEEKRR